MKNNILLYLFCFILLSSCGIHNHQLVYKYEHNNEPFSNHAINLFFDGSGLLYPSHDLPLHNQLNKNTSYLWDLYSTNQAEFLSIASKYQFFPTTNDSLAIEQLQRFILEDNINRINQKAKDYDQVVFLIHGYNQTYRQSIYPYSFFKERIQSLVQGNTLFVQVYWDGLTDKSTKPVLQGKNIYYKRQSRINQGLAHLSIWRQATYNAMYVGQELRTLLSGMHQENIYLITHSLGARVASTALFPLPMFEKPSKTPEFDERYKRSLQENISFPSQDIRVGMIAPAVDGKDIFLPYFENNIHTNTQYKFVIGWNKNDIVLRKFNLSTDKGANRFGDTSFGTLEKDINVVKTLFQEHNQSHRFSVVDFSNTVEEFDQFKHSSIYYIENPNFEQFIHLLFQ